MKEVCEFIITCNLWQHFSKAGRHGHIGPLKQKIRGMRPYFAASLCNAGLENRLLTLINKFPEIFRRKLRTHNPKAYGTNAYTYLDSRTRIDSNSISLLGLDRYVSSLYVVSD